MLKNVVRSISILLFTVAHLLASSSAMGQLKSSTGKSFEDLYLAATTLENADWKNGIIYPSAAYLSAQGVSAKELINAGNYHLMNAKGDVDKLEMGAFFLSVAPLLEKAGLSLDEIYSAFLNQDSDLRKEFQEFYGFEGGFLTQVTIAHGYTPEDLRKYGIQTLRSADGDPRLVQKGFVFLNVDKIRKDNVIRALYKDRKIDLKERNSKRSAIHRLTETDFRLGLMAKQAAEQSADPDSNYYDIDRALDLHANAGRYGIQSSYIAAGFIHRFMDKKELLKTRRMGSLIETEAMYFRKATACEFFGDRKMLPYTEELCEAARIELADANKRASLAHSEFSSAPSESVRALWGFVGVVGLAILAGQGSSSDYNLESADYGWKQPPMNALEMNEWLK